MRRHGGDLSHGLRLEEGLPDISSHSDLYAPHANVRGHWAKVTETKIARNTVVLDEEACLVLPEILR